MDLIMTLSLNDSVRIECHYAKCRVFLTVMLSVVMQNVIMLGVVGPSQIVYVIRIWIKLTPKFLSRLTPTSFNLYQMF